MESEKQLEILMEMIAYAGEARSIAIEAISMAREGKLTQAKEQVKAAEKVAYKSHNLHSDMLACEADGRDMHITMLTLHAADHLTEAVMAIDMAREMIELYVQLTELRKER